MVSTRPEPAAADLMPLAVAVASVMGLVCTLTWAATGSGYFWPFWVWLGLVLVFIPFVWWVRWQGKPLTSARWLRLHAEVSGIVVVVAVLVWLSTGTPGWWPYWPALSLLALWAVHALVVHRGALPFGPTRQLTDRVETLSRTRRAAIDAQAAELRRIERDLHDGAQARLVALSMHLGRAEARLADRPEEAELLREARAEASAAIRELRDLARGIAPPVLVDRGLPEAVRSLTERASGPVSLAVSRLPDRLPAAVENAAYFVTAEALTNVAKHAPGAATSVLLEMRDGVLVVGVDDDGPGGADPRGRGLQGLRSRIEALDGTFEITSPLGGPTLVVAQVPCGS